METPRETADKLSSIGAAASDSVEARPSSPERDQDVRQMFENMWDENDEKPEGAHAESLRAGKVDPRNPGHSTSAFEAKKQ